MTERRVSIRQIAIKYGLPTGVVARAVSTGQLPAVVTLTETGRERAYISPSEADSWFHALVNQTPSQTAQVQ